MRFKTYGTSFEGITKKNIIMVGDVLLMNCKHMELAAKLASIAVNHPKKRISISIGGESGSGKSEVAEALRNKLRAKGLWVKILHLDNYYKVSPDKRNEHRKAQGMGAVGIHEINWEQVNSNADAFYAGNLTPMPYLDLFTNQKDLLYSNLKKIDILLIEGLYACHYPSDIGVFIDLSYNETRKAQVTRKKEEMNSFRLQVLEKERDEVLKTRYMADYFVTPSFKMVSNIHRNLISAVPVHVLSSIPISRTM
jgi:uridine kinase